MLRLVVSNPNPIKPAPTSLVRQGSARLQIDFHARSKLCRLIQTKADEANKSTKDVFKRISTRTQAVAAIIPHMEAMINEVNTFIEKNKQVIARGRGRRLHSV